MRIGLYTDRRECRHLAAMPLDLERGKHPFQRLSGVGVFLFTSAQPLLGSGDSGEGLRHGTFGATSARVKPRDRWKESFLCLLHVSSLPFVWHFATRIA